MTRGRASLALTLAALAAGFAGLTAGSPAPDPTATPTPLPSATSATPASTTPTSSTAAPKAEGTPTAEAASELPKCADCHTDLVAAFARNPHTRYSGKGTKPGPEDMCSTCHGDGTKHIENGGDKAFISVPRGATGSQDCLACHETVKPFSTGGQDSFSKGTQDSFAHSVHANSAAVNCLTCHSMHSPVQKSTFLLAKPPGELCATCHTTQTAAFQNKPYVHRLDRGGMTCLDCHSPHAKKGQAVKMTTQGELRVSTATRRCADRSSSITSRARAGTASPATSRMVPTTRTCSSGRASSSSACPATPRPEDRGRSARSLRRSMT